MEEIKLYDISNLSMRLPCTLFETLHRFNDTSADDMKYGDMDERQLRALGLDDISVRVDPYRLIRYDFPKPENYRQFENDFSFRPVEGRKISRHECTQILFDEMKDLCHTFAIWGEYKHLIVEMIDHLRNGQGTPYYSPSLDRAYQQRIVEPGYDSPVSIIKRTINNFQRTNALTSYLSFEHQLKSALHSARLPKFNLPQDRINGLGVTVHDIHAQRITLRSLSEYAIGWNGWLAFDGQDHFGLDVTDIQNPLYRNFRFFRIWFFLQRYRDFAFRPYFANFNTRIMINEHI